MSSDFMNEGGQGYFESPEETQDQKKERLIRYFFGTQDKFENSVSTRLRELKNSNGNEWISDLDILENLISGEKIEEMSIDEKSVLVDAIDKIRLDRKKLFENEEE